MPTGLATIGCISVNERPTGTGASHRRNRYLRGMALPDVAVFPMS